MLRFSQGHEKGIGLEVLLKSLLCLSPQDQNLCSLYLHKKKFEYHLKNLNLSIDAFKKIHLNFFEDVNYSISDQSLKNALADMKPSDTLVTMPTSKDQLQLGNNQPKGHTEFLREYYKQDSLVMFFKSPEINLVLLTDHIPLGKVSSLLTPSLIEKKIQIIKTQKYYSFKDYIVAGINPHAGENTLLGNEEVLLNSILQKYLISDAVPGDTLWQYANKDRCLISPYHDQGLSYFKATQKFIGANITLGLPFLRLSVDHGTAFNLYGKGIADYRGCLYVIKEALKNEKNQNH